MKENVANLRKNISTQCQNYVAQFKPFFSYYLRRKIMQKLNFAWTVCVNMAWHDFSDGLRLNSTTCGPLCTSPCTQFIFKQTDVQFTLNNRIEVYVSCPGCFHQHPINNQTHVYRDILIQQETDTTPTLLCSRCLSVVQV